MSELHSLYDVIHAWMDSGPHPLYHEQMKQQVHKSMPLLARALDRLVLEHINTHCATIEQHQKERKETP